MLSARVSAIVIVLLLVGGLSFAGMGIAAWLGPLSSHGNDVMHADGKIIQVGPGKNFVLETEANEKLAFVCNTSCHASLRHLIRHVKEKAHTDVYYTPGPDRELLVVSAD